MNIVSRVKDFCTSNLLIHPNDKIIIGISGGPDSVALTHILHQLQYTWGLKLHLAHVNHHLRRGANRDQGFVEKFAKKMNLPLTVHHWKKLKKMPRGSIEELAREERLSFFIKLRKKINADSVALAHTQNDLAETVLMRILRGTGLQGLRAILPYKEMGEMTLIRPLLALKKTEIIQYLKTNRLSYCLDLTNKDTAFFRNKMRHELLPILERQYNPNITESLEHLAESSGEDYEYLMHQSKILYKKLTAKNQRSGEINLPLSALRKSPLALQRMVFRLAFAHLKGDTNQLTLAHIQKIEQLNEQSPDNAFAALPSKIYFIKNKKNLKCFSPSGAKPSLK